MKIYGFLLLLFITTMAQSQKQTQLLEEGNQYYKVQQFTKAEEFYKKASVNGPSKFIAQYNWANSLQRQNKQEEAIALYISISENCKENGLKANAFYNKGVVLSSQKKLEESIEAYKDALRIAPADSEARENLQKALLELKKKNPPKKQNEKENQQKKQQQQQKKQPKMSQKEAEQRLRLLEQKEKEVNQRLQKEKAKTGSGQSKDW